MSHEFEDFATENARVTRRERKRHGPKVVMDNPGLRIVTAALATSLRERNARRNLTSIGEK